jgi:hypothetical protein
VGSIHSLRTICILKVLLFFLGCSSSGQDKPSSCQDENNCPSDQMCLNSKCEESTGDIVTDPSIGKIWTRNVRKSGLLTWDSARAYCSKLSAKDKVEWRLPSLQELHYLCCRLDSQQADKGCIDPHERPIELICRHAKHLFGDSYKADSVWSSTIRVPGDNMYTVNIFSGLVSARDTKSEYTSALCIR